MQPVSAFVTGEHILDHGAGHIPIPVGNREVDSLEDVLPGSTDSRSAAEILLEPHLSYLPVLGPLLADERLRALAHITGGGLTDNLPRILEKGLQARIDLGTFQKELKLLGNITLIKVFGFGHGLCPESISLNLQ